jgi:2-phospho-L-lactate guanylyltransferase
VTPPTLVVPIRDFRGFTRLSMVLSPDQRTTLAVGLADRVRDAAKQAGLPMIIVSGDADVHHWADRHGVAWLDDPGSGLDVACEAATAGLDRWLVVHADLPLITIEALHAVVSAMARGTVLVPSQDGGTSVIGHTGRFPFSYGPGSFHRHLGAAPCATVLTTPELSIDLDRESDLAALTTLGHEPTLA